MTDDLNPIAYIGLGGTGSEAGGELNARLLTEYHYQLFGKDPAFVGLPAYLRHGYNVSVLALDVDKIKRPSGGRHLEPSIEDLGLDAPIGQVITYLKKPADGPRSAYPTIEQFLSRAEAAGYDVSEAMQFMSSGAGQIRQFGRMAFFLDVLNKGQIVGKIGAALAEMRKHTRPGGELGIHIGCSVAGGAGGGLLVDTLMYLADVKQRLAGQVSMRTIVYVVLPGAFQAVLEPDELELSQANGRGALRELDRMLNASATMRVSWQPGREVRIEGSVVDHVYLIDGTRDLEQGVQLDHQAHPEDTFPVAIADAVYAHAFPSTAEVLLRDYANLSAPLIAGDDNRYSTFGTYSILYDWEHLMVALDLRASREVLLSRLQPTSLHTRELANQFLSGQARDTFSHDGEYKSLPFLLTQVLNTPDALTGALDPVSHWLEPAEGAAPFPDVPNLHDNFPELRKRAGVRWTTHYDNDQVISDTAGDPAVGTTGLLGGFWGEEFAEHKPGVSEPQFHPVANTNTRTAEADYVRSLYIATIAVMSMNQAVGAIPGALDFLKEIDQRLETYSRYLDKIELAPLAEFVTAVEDAKEEMQDDRHWDDGREQHNYLEAEQELLHEKRRHVILERAKKLITGFRYATAQVKDHVRGWEDQIRQLAEAAERHRLAINEQRKAADTTALRRMTPQPESVVDELLYRDCVGQDDPDLHIASGLLDAMTSRPWNLHTRPDKTQIITWTFKTTQAVAGSEPTPITLDDLTAALSTVFAPLRQRHLFEILALEGNSAEQLADEVRYGSARLAAFDQAQQLEYTIGNIKVQDWHYTWADWPTQGPGAELAGAVKERLTGAKAANTPDPCQDLTAAARDSGLATTDKLISFSARHLILLDAFRGVDSLETSYRERRTLDPSPHVLPEEKGAARLEARSEQLAHDGVLQAPLNRIPPELVPLCADLTFLQRFAIVYASDKISHVVTDALEQLGTWQLQTRQGTVELGHEWELADVLRRIMFGTDHASITAREAVKQEQLSLMSDTATQGTVLAFAFGSSRREAPILDRLLAVAVGAWSERVE